jgi:hypothetical protein
MSQQTLPSDARRPPKGLVLQDRVIGPIRTEDVPAGSLVCTVELTSLNAINLTIISLQFLKGFFTGSARNVHNMVHWEVATKPLPGNQLEIAHASGLSKRIETEIQRISAFPPGTLLVALTPRNSETRAGIVSLAYQTSNKGNRWKIKGLSNDNQECPCALKTKAYRMEQMAVWLVDLSLDCPLRDLQGNLEEFSCLDYVQTVLNLNKAQNEPYIQTILKMDLSREEKIARISSYLQNRDMNFFDCSLSSDLALQLLDRENEWEVVGFLGQEIPDKQTKVSAKHKERTPHAREQKNLERLDLAKQYLDVPLVTAYAVCIEKTRLGDYRYLAAAGALATTHLGMRFILNRWATAIERSYKAQDPTDQLVLSTDKIRYGERPWVMFCGQGGKWHVLPLEKADGSGIKWVLNVRVEGDKAEYKFFIGCWETHGKDPMQGASWQKTESGGNVVIQSEDLDSLPMGENGLRVHHCAYPSWENR